jgi:starch synthase (maltosyl-transferring)
MSKIEQVHCQNRTFFPARQSPKKKSRGNLQFLMGNFSNWSLETSRRKLETLHVETFNLSMIPATGENLLRFVGDKIIFTLQVEKISSLSRRSETKTDAFLRTNLGRAAARRCEIISAHAGGAKFAGESWRDLPMQKTADGWQIEIPLAEVGYFKAKAYLLDEKKWQHWPDGSDVGISVHPNFARTANTIYCAFTRLFGATKNLETSRNENLDAQLKSLDEKNFTVIPPSGTFRDLKKQLPHIVQKLGCKIIHLLPIHPTPTTYARFGRFGSPYAALDLTAVDPALVEFDKRTTGVDQFCELTYAAHSLGARVFLDIVINHTGWGSVLQENSPEFFLKKPDGEFESPGAWGTIWEDLVELKQDSVLLWDKIADALLIWCRRGTDGFRCDAGYKIPVAAWQYIIARVQNEFPETIFLLEGLGGPWLATENLLTDGGMQWAYSELFQNYSGAEISKYLDYANLQSSRIGTYVHYSETHDNNRLAAKISGAGVSPVSQNISENFVEPKNSSAKKNEEIIPGRAWSLLRNRLCALTSPNGGFGFTCGVEWLATEKINVHSCSGLNWDATENIIPELAELNKIISDHPAFFDGAKLTRWSEPDAPIYALLRESAEGKDSVLIFINTDVEKENEISFEAKNVAVAHFKFEISNLKLDLLKQSPPEISAEKEKIIYTLAPGACHCLTAIVTPSNSDGENYRRARAQAAFAIQALNQILPSEKISNFDWQFLAQQIENSPQNFLAAASHLHGDESQTEFSALIEKAARAEIFPNVIVWTLIDARRVTLIPANHWLLIQDDSPFRATLKISGETGFHVQSISAGKNFIAVFAPRENFADAELILERYCETSQKISAPIRFLAPEPQLSTLNFQSSTIVLLTNGIGGMARICADLGRVNSKYDCVLGANLNPNFPVDRHIFVKRMRVWINVNGFLSPLDFKNLRAFEKGSIAIWNFVANAGDGRTVEIELRAEMLEEKNTVVFQFSRPPVKSARGKQLPADADVRLTIRFDIEDRNFHSETKRNGAADFHFSSNCREIKNEIGFEFTPAPDRQLKIFSDAGNFHPQPEWCENIPHPVEQKRAQTGSGDAYSPGWFEIPLAKGASAILVATAESNQLPPEKIELEPCENDFAAQLEFAAKQFVVRRDAGKTVIAGYPWFLDWGRDSLICARGLLAAGMVDEVKQLLLTFAKFEKDGTLPNTIHGSDVSNRDTSDAPLWFAIVCEEFSEIQNSKLNSEIFCKTRVDENGRTIFDVLKSIAENYARGTPNGIKMDSDSALIWSPGHFTWMDTNFPAGTPREGYPVEIQVLWIRLLRQLEKISAPAEQKKWRDLAEHATASFEKLFWLEDKRYFADVLLAKKNVIAHDATPDDALRSNCLFAVSLGLISGERAKRCVAAAQKYLVVPGALRSLAPLPVSIPLTIYGNDGKLLNDPPNPYWPRYEGDEDTRRKPAYHNGTAWTWTFPNFCEALARAWEFSVEAIAAAKSYLSSSEKILNEGCIGQIPEILDGDAPHLQRGCDAQAWGVTENLRVWKLLNSKNPQAK